MADFSKAPYYDSTRAEIDKGYTGLLFTGGRAIQGRELTSIGSYSYEHIKKLASLLYKSGTIINGCKIQSINKADSTVTMTEGSVFVDGEIFDIVFERPNPSTGVLEPFNPDKISKTIPIKMSGIETIYVEILTDAVDHIKDPTLLDPAEGFDNYNEPGAARIRKLARYISTSHPDFNNEQLANNPRIPIHTLIDGELKIDNSLDSNTNVTENKPADNTAVDTLELLAQRTHETNGDYIIEGFKVSSIECQDFTKIGLMVDPGVAYISGKRFETQSTRKIFIEKNLVQNTIFNEEHQINDTNKYKLKVGPVLSAKVTAPVKDTQQLVYNAATPNIIPVPNAGVVYKVIKVYTEGPSGKIFQNTIDYNISGNTINWVTSGEHPASSFKVDYTYKKLLTEDSYILSSEGIYNRILNLKVNSLGIASIPVQYFNPSIISVEDAKNPGTFLKKGKDWYQIGNNIKIVTKQNTSIPVEMTKSNMPIETLPYTNVEVNTIQYYSELGEKILHSEKTSPAEFDYLHNKIQNRIEWMNADTRSDLYPPVGEKYIATLSFDVTEAKNITEVNVHINYETSQDLYTNRTYTSVLNINPGIITKVDDTDTIDIDSVVSRTRKDSICLDKEGNFIVIHGNVVGENGIYETRISDSLLKIADIIIKPTSVNNVAIFQTDNYRVRMKDIRSMFSKVKDIDYNISLSFLEKYAENLSAGSSLRGILTDGFISLKMFDSNSTWRFTETEDQFAVPNIAEAKLYPGFKRFATNLEINKSKTTAGRKGDVYALSSSTAEVLWANQPFGTKVRSLSEGVWDNLLFPKLTISPDSDYFIAGQSEAIGETDAYAVIPNFFETYKFNGNATLTGTTVGDPLNNKDLTVQFWINLPKPVGTARIFETNIFSVEISSEGDILLKNKSNNYTEQYKLSDNLDILFNTWIHFAFVFNKNLKFGTTQIYLNGHRITSKNSFESSITEPTHTTNQITDFIFGTTSGNMSHIRVYNSAISEEQIRAYILAEIPENTPSLIGYYKTPVGANIENSSAFNKMSNLVKTGSISAEKADIQAEVVNPNTKKNHILNVIDITEGNVRPEDTETETHIGTDVSTSSSTISGSWGGSTTIVTTTTESFQIDKTWYTRDRRSQVQDYGTFLSGIKGAMTLRPRRITVTGTGLLPNADPIEIKFNGIKVNLFTPPSGVIGEQSGTNGCWKANDAGEFTACFMIPDNIPVGVREVTMSFPGGPVTKAIYWGAGNVVEKTNLEVQTDTITWKEHKSTEIVQRSSTTSRTHSWCNHCGDCDHCGGYCNHCGNCSHCGSNCRTVPLAQTIYINTPGLSTPIISDIRDYSDIQVTSVDLYMRQFNPDTVFEVGFIELTDSGQPKSGLNTWVGQSKSFKGSDIIESEGKFEHGTAKHKVIFDYPIKLIGGKGYALIVGSADKDARVWVGKVGESEPTINNVPGKKIFKTPDKGVLLSSPNMQTWTVYIDEDLKYSMYIRDFFVDNKLENADANLSLIKTDIPGRFSILEYKEVAFKSVSNNYLKRPNFFKYDVMYTNSRDKTGYITFEYATKNNGTYSNWIEFTPGMTTYFNRPADAMKIRAKLYSFNRYNSPSIDTTAALSVGEYILPSYYVSKTVESGKYNRIDAYIDKFFNDQISDIEFKISPDGGYTWRNMELSDLKPLAKDSRFGENTPVYQYCYKDALTLDKPEILNITTVSTPTGSTLNLINGNEYEVAYCLKDSVGREGPLSDPKTFTHTSNKSPKLKIKFDPNATGYAVYLRNKTTSENFKLWYDSALNSRLKLHLDTVVNKVRIGPEGRLFPENGVIIIDSEYMKYNGRNMIDATTYELQNVERGYTHKELTCTAETHSIDSDVILADNAIINRSSITGNVVGPWRIGEFVIEKDQDKNEDYYTFEDILVSRNLMTTNADKPLYDKSYPASFDSSRLTYKIRMKNLDNSTSIEKAESLICAGRVIVNTSFEAF